MRRPDPSSRLMKRNMDSYFTISCPMPRVYRLEDPRGVFLTLLVGDSNAFLADTGTGIGDLCGTLSRLTDLPIIVANTHGHIDHTGGNYLFSQVWLAEEDHSLVRQGLSPESRQQILSLSLLPPSFDQTGFLSYEGDNLLPLGKGQVFDLGGLTVNVVPLPSHTKGSVGFFCPELELLLTGDSMSTVTYLLMEESCTVREYITLLEAIENIPFSRMLSAHERSVMERECLEAFRQCALQVEPEKTVSFKNPFFPRHPGRLFVYKTPLCPNGYAALVYSPEKLNRKSQ